MQHRHDGSGDSDIRPLLPRRVSDPARRPPANDLPAETVTQAATAIAVWAITESTDPDTWFTVPTN